MIGKVDDAGRALLTLEIRPTADSPPENLEAWIDTAFDGDLVVSTELIDKLGLGQSSVVEAILADGKKVVLETYSCDVQWRGEWRQIEAFANRGRLPLLGIGLLKDCRLNVDYPNGTLRID